MRTVTLVATLSALASLNLFTPAVLAEPAIYPDDDWLRVEPVAVGLDRRKLNVARDYALTSGGAGLIVRHGKLVMSWGDEKRRFDLKSTSKSIGVTALGLAIDDGKIKLSDRARQHHPKLGTPPTKNADTGWLDEITILHLATQTAGFEKPGGYQPLVFRPGTKWHYSDGGPNWLAECVTRVYQRDVESLLFQRVFTPIGITRDDLRWREHAYRPVKIDGITRCEFGSGVHANVDAMARIGYLYLREGVWLERQLLSARFANAVGKTLPAVVGLDEFDIQHGNASDHYGLLWWNNADGSLPKVPRSTFWSWGLYDSLIVVIPELDIVIARAGKSWDRKGWDAHYGVLAPFLNPVVAAATSPAARPDPPAHREEVSAAPYPGSPVITGISWSPKSTIVRQARGSDNWPATWADDDHLYTAYGDGRGFKPFVPYKLSMGFARIDGFPADLRGVNLRSDGETRGDGAGGKKASGLLMVDGVLYLWARNAGNSQLAWSTDHAKTWTWADWKFTTSFGAPTFLNFGRNYSNARDDFVYVFSHDSGSAYQAADRMVLARVRQDRIRLREAYQFFVKLNHNQEPEWSDDIAERGAVFSHPGQCYRNGISYNPGLRRYLWCQVLPESKHPQGTRFSGGFGVYDAPEPWGPWTTVFFTHQWDVGPGETSSFPPKWITADGKQVHLLFSGDDCCSVRKAVLRLATARSSR